MRRLKNIKILPEKSKVSNEGSRDKICTSVVGELGTVPMKVKGNYLKHLGV